MDNQHQHHGMEVSQNYETGAQEFYCPTCGRRFVMQWPPHYRRIILSVGNEQAEHSGGTIGVSSSLEKKDHYLDVWDDYLDSIK